MRAGGSCASVDLARPNGRSRDPEITGKQARSAKVAVLDPLACFRRGLVAALVTAGFEPIEPPDVEDWIRSDNAGAVIIALLGEVDAKRLRGFRDCAPTMPGLALLSEVTLDSYRWAIRSGATSAVGRDATPDDIIQALAAAYADRAIVPASIASAFAMAVDPGDHPILTMPEVRWLAALSEGSTVADLARDAGYSEREMFRRLHKLYARMGVSGRTEALLAAQRWGLV